MYLVTRENYKRAAEFSQSMQIDKVYPLSITDGFQSGEIFTISQGFKVRGVHPLYKI